jgi:hypothetical protein
MEGTQWRIEIFTEVAHPYIMAFKNIKEARGVSVETFRNEIVPASEPVVLRGVATHWPAVAAAKASPQDFDAYLGRFDSGKTVESFIGAPEIEGRFFYDPEMRGVNFKPLRCWPSLHW